MQDAEIVASIVAGQTAGLAEAYDRYAPALHTYCRSLLSEPADAADAVQDTFVIAAAKLGGLRDPGRLRPWLYAVARNECHRRLRSRRPSVPLAEAGELTGRTVDLGADAERAELRALVGAALDGLNPGDREIIELNLRHELSGAELAGALGVSPSQAHALASRARAQFETSLGALPVARTGRDACPELAAMLYGWDGQLTTLLRKRVNRHIEQCEVCGARRRRELSPAMLLSMLPVVLLPSGLRDRLFRLVSDPSPAAVSYRAQVAGRAGPFGQDGFPRPLDRPRTGRGLKNAALAAAACVAALAVVGGGVLFSALVFRPAGQAAAAPPPATTSATPSGSVAAAVRKPAPSASVPPATPASTPSSPASHAASPSRTPARTPTPTPTPTPSPAPGKLVLSATLVRLARSAAAPAGPYLGSFTITAHGGPVASFHIGNPHPLHLTVTPLTGSLVKGQRVVIHIRAPAVDPHLPYLTYLTVNPGGQTVTVEYPPSG